MYATAPKSKLCVFYLLSIENAEICLLKPQKTHKSIFPFMGFLAGSVHIPGGNFRKIENRRFNYKNFNCASGICTPLLIKKICLKLRKPPF